MRKRRQFLFIPIALFLVVFIVFVSLMRNAKNEEHSPQEIEYDYIYILMKDNDKPYLDYEGDGFRKLTSCNYILGESGETVPHEIQPPEMA